MPHKDPKARREYAARYHARPEVAVKQRGYYLAKQTERQEKSRQHYRENKAEVLEQKRTYYTDNKPEILAQRKTHYHRGGGRARVLRNKYGITVEQWEKIFDKQDRCCAVCRRSTPMGRGWATDHNHVTLVVRGILCSNCNAALGLLQDSPGLMRVAADYVEKAG